MSAAGHFIEQAIEANKSVFDDLVREFARLTYPTVFERISSRGSTSDNIPISGWPDMYGPGPDGTICAAEATTEDDWLAHLREDVAKVEKYGKNRIHAYLFACWGHKPALLPPKNAKLDRHQEIKDLEQRLKDVGVPEDNIYIVFREDLVTGLTDPKFDLLLYRMLGIQSHALPFERIGDIDRLYGRDGDAMAFSPSRSEYEAGAVHRPAIADHIQEMLARDGSAWVQGRGAAGKTILAVQLARPYNIAYYLDFTQGFETIDAANAISSSADSGVLFILDNVHLDEARAGKLFGIWTDNPHGSHLLVLGREVSVSDSKGTVRPLESLVKRRVTLEIGENDLAGVYRRIIKRFHSLAGDPPRSVLNNWAKLFAGDLIAFSAAIAGRIESIAVGDWQLGPRDAALYVKTAYIDHASSEERDCLLSLAVLAQLEIAAVEPAINAPALRSYIRSGLVHTVDARGRRLYYLIHPGMGDLILSAAGYSGSDLSDFSEDRLVSLASLSPYLADPIMLRLEALSRHDCAAMVARGFQTNYQIVKLITSRSFAALEARSKRFKRLAGISTSDLDLSLSSNPDAVIDAASSTELGDLRSAMEYVSSELPVTHQMLVDWLELDLAIDPICRSAQGTPIAGIFRFLSYVKTMHPKFFRRFVKKICDPIFEKPLASLVAKMPFNEVAYALEESKSIEPAVHFRFSTLITDDNVISSYVEKSYFGALDHLVSFLSIDTVAGKVIEAIDLDKWEESFNQRKLYQPSYFTPLVKTLTKYNREELAIAPACAIIREASSPVLDTNGLVAHHLSRLIRLGRVAGEAAILKLLDRVVDEEWLKNNFRYPLKGREGVTASSLARSLFSIWGYHDSAVLERFKGSHFSHRYYQELLLIYKCDPLCLVGALQFVGVCHLFEVNLDTNQPPSRWPSQDTVNRAISCFPVANDEGDLLIVQIQLWIGLRVLASLSGQMYSVDKEIGGQVLALWRAATGHVPKHMALNRWMIEWLDRCAAVGWKLLPDNTPFQNAEGFGACNSSSATSKASG